MTKGRYLWVLLLLIEPSTLSVALPSSDEAIGEIYLREGLERIQRGEGQSSRSFLRRATLFFSEPNSDLLYAEALLARENSHFLLATDKARKAIEEDRWFLVEKKEGDNLLSQLLLRTRKLDELIGRYSVLATSPDHRRRIVARVAFAFLYKGLPGKAYRLATMSLRRDPSELSLYEILLTLDPRQETVNRYRDALMRYPARSSLSLLRTLIVRQRHLSALFPVVEYYKDRHGEDGYTAAFDLIQKRGDLDRNLTLLAESGDCRELELLVDVYRALPSESKAAMTAFFLSLTGLYTYDATGDSFPEEVVTLDAGEIVERALDSQGDGILEKRIFYQGNKPVAVEVTSPFHKKEHRFHYGLFPALDTVSVKEATFLTTYSFTPEVAFFPEEVLQPVFGLVPFLLRLTRARVKIEGLPTERELASQAYLVKESWVREGKTVKQRHLFLEEGYVVFLSEDRNGDGLVDSQLFLKKGQPLLGKRDLQGEGTFEVTDHYRKGEWIGLSLDENRNGLPEYVRSWEDLPDQKKWDRDEDGRYDLVSRSSASVK